MQRDGAQPSRELLTILTDKHDGDIPDGLLRKLLQQKQATDLDLLPRVAPRRSTRPVVGAGLPPEMCSVAKPRDDIAHLQRPDAQAWTVSDLPFLDAAWHRARRPGGV